ncbi:DNA topoisomerase III [Anaerotignum propionicum]|uniref:DNA topoisomerase n=1 Tax=Anaerotignum propionicum DSM 1682 TaxID=991789 RepID=A0A0X1U7G5_ANAPI|nr:DNA topoisomerase III [Anaerotignum propionicum]AMJ40875.1 DNA topoisomerase 3 [Anaerotignum propionicum DSM 1682]SHE75456.1 DNA topoisomerase-3 [[Clostridium] propionicum DSM 1682] [Anaerotignum propionicum DSM 1682]
MGRILVVAEKPSVARDIAKTLGAGQKGDGCLLGEKYVVSWAIGHLVTLAEPEEYGENFKKWSFASLPIIPDEMELKAIKNTRSQLKVLHKWMNDKEITSIICATDSGREGELIFRYIYEITKCNKPFQRLWISSMTEQAIKEGFANLKDGTAYDLLYHSAKCRSEADWLVGMNATRAYTLRYHVLLSIGRVQTPTLALIVDKQKEINAFVSKDYYEIQTVFDGFHGFWIDEEEQTKIENEAVAKEISDKINAQDSLVTKVEKEEKRIPAPLLYDLTELQRECNRKFGYSAKKTLDIAQSLYEKRKMITYPRTDSRYLSDDMKGKVQNTMKRLGESQPFEEFATPLINGAKLLFTKRIIDNSKVTDHHAIIPTDVRPRLDSLAEEEKNVFLLVAARFISAFYPHYRYEVTKVYFTCQDERLLSKGTVVLEEGWQGVERKLVPMKGKKEKGNEEQKLPPLTEGELHKIKEAKVLKKKTTPPKAYTESSLLSAMENAGRFVEDETLKEQMKDSGLGTPATRAAIIERLLSVGYITRKGKNLIPTEKGMQLIQVVPEELRSPQTTGKWEKGLSSIAKGNMEEERFMASIKRYVSFLVEDAIKRKTDIVFPEEAKMGAKKGGKSLGKCPICKDGDVLENSKAYFCGKWKTGCKFTVWKDSLTPYGIELNSKTIQKLLKEEKIPDVSVTLPQTGEKGKSTMIFSADGKGQIELMDFTRDEMIEGKESSQANEGE